MRVALFLCVASGVGEERTSPGRKKNRFSIKIRWNPSQFSSAFLVVNRKTLFRSPP